MAIKFKNPAALSGIALVAALSLAGCGGSADSSQAPSSSPDAQVTEETAELNQVYQFDEMRVTSVDDAEMFYGTNAEPLVIKLSDELKEARPAGTEIFVESFEVQLRSYPTGSCVIEAHMNYPNGVQPKGDVLDVGPKIIQYGDRAEVVDEIPSDDDLVVLDGYFTSDYSTFIQGYDCQDAVTDGSLAALQFTYEQPYEKASDFDSDVFALADILVFADDTFVVKGDVVGAEVSLTGKWKTAD